MKKLSGSAIEYELEICLIGFSSIAVYSKNLQTENCTTNYSSLLPFFLYKNGMGRDGTGRGEGKVLKRKGSEAESERETTKCNLHQMFEMRCVCLVFD